MRKRMFQVVAALFLFTTLAFSQTQTGTIVGVVKDNTGAVIPNATVTVTSANTGASRTSQTDAGGTYRVIALLPGPYDVAISSGNFGAFRQRVEVTVGGNLTVDASLAPSATSTTVEVSAAPTGIEINTQNQEVSQIITPEQVAQLPSLTHNPYDFVALAGNVSGGDRGNEGAALQLGYGGGQNNSDLGVGFYINGQRSSGTEVLLDGIENTNIFDTTISLLIPQDAMLEFRIITNNFDAQYGRASGGVVNVTSKSGTNDFHGSVWEFNRLSAYTANTYDNVVNAVPKGKYTRNQFGFTAGGPIKKNKLFFFASTEWTRVRSSASLLSYVPTPQFIAAMAPNVQPMFAKYGANNFKFLSTVTKTDPGMVGNYTVGGPFDMAVGAATPVFGLVNYTVPADAGGDFPQNTYESLARLDYNYSDKTQMFFRYGRENLSAFPGTIFQSPYSQYDVGDALVSNDFLLSINHTFSPTFLSNTKISFTREYEANSYNSTLQLTPSMDLNGGTSLDGQSINLPGFYDLTPGGGGLPYGGPQNTLPLYQDFSWIRGNHTIKFGGELNYLQMNKAYGAYAQAVEQFNSGTGASGVDNLVSGTLFEFTGAVNPQGKVPCTRNFQTLALNQTPACTVTLPATSPSFARSYRYRDWAAYVDDSWKVTPQLTFNYGVRYEYYGVQHNDNQNLDSNIYYGAGAGSNWALGLRDASIQISPKSSVGGMWSPRYGGVAPRLGFAYDVSGKGTTSVRGGYGISYERNYGNVTFNMIQNPPNYASVNEFTTPATVSDFGPLAGTGAPVALPPVSPRMVDQNIKIAQTQFYSFSLEHKLGTGTVIELDYNGAHGVHLYDLKNINASGSGNAYLGDPLVTTAACGGPCYTRVNPQFTSVNNRGSQGFSHYNALNLKVQTSNLGNTGLSFLNNYTLAHAQDNLSTTFSLSSQGGSAGNGNLGYLDPRNPALDYGNADFDVRNRDVFSAIWAEPFFKGRSVMGEALGGWTLTPIFTARTGTPFSIFDSTNSMTGFPYGVVRYTPATPIQNYQTGTAIPIGPNTFNLLHVPVANSWVGPLGVSDYGTGGPGLTSTYPSTMTQRNAFRGPGAWTYDMSVSKDFKVTERVGLQFRAEAFNLLNHHNMYYNGYLDDFHSVGTATGMFIEGKKGGLGGLSEDLNHDERRFGQFALRASF